jgi:hypothetical protein
MPRPTTIRRPRGDDHAFATPVVREFAPPATTTLGRMRTADLHRGIDVKRRLVDDATDALLRAGEPDRERARTDVEQLLAGTTLIAVAARHGIAGGRTHGLAELVAAAVRGERVARRSAASDSAPKPDLRGLTP